MKVLAHGKIEINLDLDSEINEEALSIKVKIKNHEFEGILCKPKKFICFFAIDKEEFIKIGTLLNMFKAPISPIPLFIQD